jgi:FlaA1/EpsC-like NDP-sugar epimerase
MKMKKNTEKLKTQIKPVLKNKTILITGGAGSVGSSLVKKIINYPVKSIRVLDIDEHALFRLGRC